MFDHFFDYWISELSSGLFFHDSPLLISLFACRASWSVAVSVAAPLAVSGGGLPVSVPTMMIKETSLRRDPDLRGELAFLARGCDFVLPSRFKKRLKSFQQQQVSRCNKQGWMCDEFGCAQKCKLMTKNGLRS